MSDKFFPMETTEISWEIVEDFTITLKRFGIVNRVVRHEFATELHILLTQGSDVLSSHREAVRHFEDGDF